jgi:hypothetical protein
MQFDALLNDERRLAALPTDTPSLSERVNVALQQSVLDQIDAVPTGESCS